jgi:hypothetical protein
MGLPAVADTCVRGDEADPKVYSYRHPQHLALAAALGLGVFARERRERKRIDLGSARATR